jgi:hypothetical protein
MLPASFSGAASLLAALANNPNPVTPTADSNNFFRADLLSVLI